MGKIIADSAKTGMSYPPGGMFASWLRSRCELIPNRARFIFEGGPRGMFKALRVPRTAVWWLRNMSLLSVEPREGNPPPPFQMIALVQVLMCVRASLA